jgi:lipopolysaccharide transport system ATP-binding protein
MSDTAIQIDNVSKLYKLGSIGSGSLKQDLERWWITRVQKKSDPFSYQSALADQPLNQSYIWALKQINLEIKKGEVWGLIGGNGSGKSTLLKIISRIVRPTQGVVRGNGRLSSLLEVGAGFNPELSGRENIYLSGYILGMQRHEIRQRFDEIVDFSGVAQFIDTPVKRYSSGMYVRLAFAVAAHLNSDIMLIDEILAVGDTEFQKKCLAKMQDFARHDGRTIVFVSHNLQAVGHLCQHALWLRQGNPIAIGPVQSIINQYMGQNQSSRLHQTWLSPADAPGNDCIRIKSILLTPQSGESGEYIDTRTPLTIRLEAWTMQDNTSLLFGFQLFAQNGECVFDVMSSFNSYKRGVVEAACDIPGNFLNDGSYYISVIIYQNSWEHYYYYEGCLAFDVDDFREDNMRFNGKWWGVVRPQFPIRSAQVEDSQVSGLTELVR